jgi:SAM-dependent methyltransferase
MSDPRIDKNLEIYSAPDVAAHYATLNYLSPCERLLFEMYIPEGSAILDLGVGGGRTTPFLSSRASHYVGLDYSSSMVERCHTKYPDLQFRVGDAADLSTFPDSQFDAVVFAYNGIDFVLPASSRQRCLKHVFRVLKPGGVLIFSSHNARAILVRPSWNLERLQKIADGLVPNSNVQRGVLLAGLVFIRRVLALGYAGKSSFVRMIQRLPTRTFWSGDGYRMDPAHGGLYTHYSVPRRVVSDVRAMNLRSVRILGDDYPKASHPLATDWYYYVFEKTP